MTFIFAFLGLIQVPDGLKYVAETGAVERPLRVIWRGANRPYFGKQGTIKAYSPQEQKPGDLQGFPGMARTGKQEKEPELGLFYLSDHTLLFPVSPMREQGDLAPHPRNHPDHLLRRHRVHNLRQHEAGHRSKQRSGYLLHVFVLPERIDRNIR